MAYSLTMDGGSIALKTPEQTPPDVSSQRLRKCLAWRNKTFPHKKMTFRSALAEMLELAR